MWSQVTVNTLLLDGVMGDGLNQLNPNVTTDDVTILIDHPWSRFGPECARPTPAHPGPTDSTVL